MRVFLVVFVINIWLNIIEINLELINLWLFILLEYVMWSEELVKVGVSYENVLFFFILIIDLINK